MHCYCVTLCACLTSRVRFHAVEFLLIPCSSGVLLFCVVLQGCDSQLLVGLIILLTTHVAYVGESESIWKVVSQILLCWQCHSLCIQVQAHTLSITLKQV
jgi:hypothetical protein